MHKHSHINNNSCICSRVSPCSLISPHWPPGPLAWTTHSLPEHLWGQKSWAMTSLFLWSPVCKEKQKNEKERHGKVTENLAVCKRETYNPQAIRAGGASRPTSPTFRRHCLLNCQIIRVPLLMHHCPHRDPLHQFLSTQDSLSWELTLI